MDGGHDILMGGDDARTSTTVLDADALRALNELVGDDPAMMADLVDAFLDEAPIRLEELRTGLRQGDLVLAGRAAHTLKSNGYTFGAQALGDLCQVIESAAREGDVTAAMPLAEQVDSEWARVRPALDNLREASH